MHALQARLGLVSIDSNAFKKALTHQSYAEQDNHEAYKSIGKRVTGLFVTEFFHCKYPNLHPQAFEKTISAYIANKTFAQIATELGMQHSIKWTRTEKLGQSTVLADCLHAVIGAVFEQGGEDAAKKFVHDFILAREMDIRPLIKMDEPKRQLSALLRQLGKPKAESRLLSETGRHSSAPVFVVGVFSETEKLGEGFGSSIKMAEFRVSEGYE
ncbi:ribonuclease III [Rhizopus microsporus var. microsporus]|uniref:Large ribosomal subunit protein mL44 n=1 Tax=Rhizopus microsporus var. microsporus TaxID=86635 RepID=A0A1X0QV32_RHIZD|nr:ribonuclease III [Rhizopus microsporus var. microsporus]